jgi:hypothetical protein
MPTRLAGGKRSARPAALARSVHIRGVNDYIAFNADALSKALDRFIRAILSAIAAA